MTEPSDTSESANRSLENKHQTIESSAAQGGHVGSGSQTPNISRGVEVLIKKAAVDPAFRSLLLEKRAEAAQDIDLALSPAETALLNTVPVPHLEHIIAHTTVPTEHRRAFLGKVAGLMLAALGVQLEACVCTTGIRPEDRVHNIPEPTVSCDPEDIRRDPDGKTLDFKVLVNGPSSVLLSVTGNGPFPDRHIEVSFRSEEKKGKTEIVHHSEWLYIGSNREIKVKATGDNGTTDWLVLRLMNRRVKPGKMKDELLQLPKQPYEPGEYVVGDCMVCRIVKFHKEWRT